MSAKETEAQEYSNIDFVNQFVEFFEQKIDRKPTFQEIKLVGGLMSRAFAIAAIEGNVADRDVLISGATFCFGSFKKSDDQETNQETTKPCDIPDEICDPIRALIEEITNPNQEDISVHLATSLISLFVEHRQNFDDPSWKTLLEYSAYSCFQYILIKRSSNKAINWYIGWLIENVPSELIQEAKNEAIFVTLKEFTIPAIADSMGETLNHYLSNVSFFDENIERQLQSSLN